MTLSHADKLAASQPLPLHETARRRLMRRFVDELRYAARALAKAPLFTAVAVVSLGLALALNTSVFALADGVLHPYVPYPEPERIIIPSFLGGDPIRALTFAERY